MADNPEKAGLISKENQNPPLEKLAEDAAQITSGGERKLHRQRTSMKEINDSAMNYDICVGLFGTGIFAILFGVFTSDEKYYGKACSDSVLFAWSRVAFWVFAAASLISIFIFPCISHCIPKIKNQSLASFLLALNVGTRLIMLLSFFTLFIALCVAYGKNEPCGELRTIALVYIIIYSIGLGLIVLIVIPCCCLCGVVGLSLFTAIKAEEELKKKDYGTFNKKEGGDDVFKSNV